MPNLKNPELPARAHSLQMENRERLRLSGVNDVGGFDENVVLLSTDLGELAIRGEALHIEKIDLASGVLELRGRIGELSYSEHAAGASFWGRLFG